MRIAFITYDYYPTSGGVETRVFNLASELAKRHEVVVYTKKKDNRDLGAFNHEVFEVDYLNLRGLKGLDFALKVKRDTAHRNLHVLNIEQFGVHGLISLFKVACTAFITVHGKDVMQPKTVLKPFYNMVLAKDYVRVVAVSSYMRREFINRFNFPAWRAHVISHGIDVSKFKPKDRKVWGRFIFVGRFVEDKDPLSCVDAIRELRDKFGVKDVELKMIGDGPLLEDVKCKIKAYGLSSVIKLLGNIPNDRLPKYYSQAMATINPRLAGMVLLESLACGTPVIAGNLNMAPEIIDRGCGYLVEPSDPIAIAKCMAKIYMLDKRSYNRITLNCRNKAENFKWTKQASELESLYVKAIDKS